MDAQDQIITLEREALDQWAAGKPSNYLKHAHDDISYYDDIGAQSGLQGLEAVRSYATAALDGNIPPHQYEMLNTSVQQYDNTGILTYQYQPFGPDGQPLTLWRASVVYSRIEGNWKMVHAHWTMQKKSD